MSKKFVTILSVLLIAVFVLAACQPAATPTEEVVAPAPVEPTKAPAERTAVRLHQSARHADAGAVLGPQRLDPGIQAPRAWHIRLSEGSELSRRSGCRRAHHDPGGDRSSPGEESASLSPGDTIVTLITPASIMIEWNSI